MAEYNAMERMEEMMDFHGMGEIIDMMSDICQQKAEYVRQMWNDPALANAWEKLGDRLTNLLNALNTHAVFEPLV
jgi:hypothetical protein